MRSFALLALPLAAWAQTEYFPLHVGNQWIYRMGGESVVVDIPQTQSAAGREYAVLRGLPEGSALVRMSDEGTLYRFNRATEREEVWAVFSTAEGRGYDTAITPCNPSAVVASRSATAKTPAGEFGGALEIAYVPSCADAGITGELYLPYIGLVERTITTIAGPRVMRLSYARVGGVTVLSEPELTFALTLDRAVHGGGPLTARFTLRNTQPAPIELHFPTGQRYDLVIRDAGAKVVYQWSMGKLFTMALGKETVGPGEKNWVVRVPLDAFEEGSYAAEVWLTTTGAKAWSASVPFQVKRSR